VEEFTIYDLQFTPNSLFRISINSSKPIQQRTRDRLLWKLNSLDMLDNMHACNYTSKVRGCDFRPSENNLIELAENWKILYNTALIYCILATRLKIILWHRNSIQGFHPGENQGLFQDF
jgi:hypothetical protein